MTRKYATSVGFGAVLLWALLALLTVGSSPTPPLLLNAICFGIGGLVGLVWAVSTGSLHELRQVPPRIYLFGTLGLFGYHLLYFSALRLAPPAEAGLIAYLWPLLIVLFSGLLPQEKLRLGHIVGAMLGFAGAGLIISGGGIGLSSEHLGGYALALCAAFTWASYSVLSRRFGDVPTTSVTVFCLGSSLLSLPLHFMFETTQLPQSLLSWGSVIGLGLGPVGLAFYIWDIGVKRGDIQLLGTSSYAAPLLSTLILVGFGVAQPSLILLWATVLITGGALIAARASLSSQL